MDRFWQKYSQLVESDPQQCLAWLEATLREQPQMAPHFRRLVRLYQAQTLNYKLQDTAKAMAILDQEIQAAATGKEDKQSPQWSLTHLLVARALIQRDGGKAEEAVTAFQKYWPKIVASAQSEGDSAKQATGMAADAYAASLLATGKSGEAATLLQQTLRAMPIYLTSWTQLEGVLLDKLSAALLASGNKAEALSWAKLRYATCDFTDAEIAAATKTLAQAWAANDDFQAINAFARAQQPATANGAAPKANPLISVALPTQSAEMAGGSDQTYCGGGARQGAKRKTWSPKRTSWSVC